MRKIISLTVFVFILNIGFSQFIGNSKSINWISFEELEAKIKVAPRKVIVDLYTVWCGPCKRMDMYTFHNPVIVKYINENYYAVKFNAEDKRTINFMNQEFKYVAENGRGINQLAGVFIQNNAFPSVTFMDEKLKVLQKFNYVDAKNMELIMTYFGEDKFKTQKWDEFVNTFKSQLE